LKKIYNSCEFIKLFSFKSLGSYAGGLVIIRSIRWLIILKCGVRRIPHHERRTTDYYVIVLSLYVFLPSVAYSLPSLRA
jgi:hypothetical protein